MLSPSSRYIFSVPNLFSCPFSTFLSVSWKATTVRDQDRLNEMQAGTSFPPWHFRSKQVVVRFVLLHLTPKTQQEQLCIHWSEFRSPDRRLHTSALSWRRWQRLSRWHLAFGRGRNDAATDKPKWKYFALGVLCCASSPMRIATLNVNINVFVDLSETWQPFFSLLVRCLQNQISKVIKIASSRT